MSAERWKILLTVADKANDSHVKSEASSLFSVSMVWHFICCNNCQQNFAICWHTLDMAIQQIKWIQLIKGIQQIQGLVTLLRKYWEAWFSDAKIEAKEIAYEMNIDQIFKERRVRYMRKKFDYESNDESSLLEAFRTGYFLSISRSSTYLNRKKDLNSWKRIVNVWWISVQL